MVVVQFSCHTESHKFIPNMVRLSTLITISNGSARNMIKMVIIELKAYGDFDSKYTDSVWVNEDLTSFNPIDFPDDRDTTNARKYLRDNGFKLMKTKTCCVGGNL